MAGTNVATLTAKLTADTTGLKAGLSSAEREVQGFGGRTSKMLGKIGPMVAVGAAAGAAAIGAMAVKGVAAFADFEQGMNEVFTLLPDITGQAMGEMEDQVKDLSTEFGVLPDKVIPSLYQAISAGVPKDNVFEFMETATKASIGGATELETAVDGLTSVINAYGAENIDAAEASDLMFTAVRLGKTTMDELSRSLFQVNPVAAAMGVEFGDITAALAAMTAQGTPTRVATTQLRQALVELGKEGTVAFDAFKEATGKTFPDFIASGGTVEDAFIAMKAKADEMGVGVGDLFGSVEAGMGVISLTSESGAAAFATNMQAMTDSAGATETAFGQMDQGLSRSFDRIKAQIGVAFIDIGEALAPFVEEMAVWLEKELPDMIEGVVEAFEAIEPVLKGLLPLFKDIVSGVADIVKVAKPILDVAADFLASRDAMNRWNDTAYESGGAWQIIGAAIQNLVTKGAIQGVTANWEMLQSQMDGTRNAGSTAVSTLSDEMLDLKRTSGQVTGTVGQDWVSTSHEITGMLSNVGDELGDSADDFKDWEKELDRSMDASTKRMNQANADFNSSLGGIISLFEGAPDQIKISVDEMIANLLATSQASFEYQAVWRGLIDDGLYALADELQRQGPTATLAFKTLASDAEQAFAVNFDLTRALMASMSGLSVEEIGHEIGGLLARATEAGYNPNLNLPSTPTSKPRNEFRALGGSVSAGTPYVVGEQGPEMFVPNQSGTIVPNGETGRTVNVYVERVESDDLAGDIAEGLIRASITEQVDLIGVW